MVAPRREVQCHPPKEDIYPSVSDVEIASYPVDTSGEVCHAQLCEGENLWLISDKTPKWKAIPTNFILFPIASFMYLFFSPISRIPYRYVFFGVWVKKEGIQKYSSSTQSENVANLLVLTTIYTK